MAGAQNQRRRFGATLPAGTKADGAADALAPHYRRGLGDTAGLSPPTPRTRLARRLRG